MRNIHERINILLTAIGAVNKGGVNAHFKFSFRGIDQCLNAMAPAIRAAGLTPSVIHELISHDVGERGSTAVVRTTFRLSCEGGEWTSTAIGEARDGGDKAIAKAMSIGFKYAVFHGLCIPYDEALSDDPDASVPQQHSARSQPTVRYAQSVNEVTGPNAPGALEAAARREVVCDFTPDKKPVRLAISEMTEAQLQSARRLAQRGVERDNAYSARAADDLEAIITWLDRPQE